MVCISPCKPSPFIGEGNGNYCCKLAMQVGNASWQCKLAMQVGNASWQCKLALIGQPTSKSATFPVLVSERWMGAKYAERPTLCSVGLPLVSLLVSCRTPPTVLASSPTSMVLTPGSKLGRLKENESDLALLISERQNTKNIRKTVKGFLVEWLAIVVFVVMNDLWRCLQRCKNVATYTPGFCRMFGKITKKIH